MKLKKIIKKDTKKYKSRLKLTCQTHNPGHEIVITLKKSKKIMKHNSQTTKMSKDEIKKITY